MTFGEVLLDGSIVAGEAAFGVQLVSGWVCRYALRGSRTRSDLRCNADAPFAHGLARAYLNSTVAFRTAVIAEIVRSGQTQALPIRCLIPLGIRAVPLEAIL